MCWLLRDGSLWLNPRPVASTRLHESTVRLLPFCPGRAHFCRFAPNLPTFRIPSDYVPNVVMDQGMAVVALYAPGQVGPSPPPPQGHAATDTRGIRGRADTRGERRVRTRESRHPFVFNIPHNKAKAAHAHVHAHAHATCTCACACVHVENCERGSCGARGVPCASASVCPPRRSLCCHYFAVTYSGAGRFSSVSPVNGL